MQTGPKGIALILGALFLSGCAGPIAYAKCGPDGAVDWDENHSSPPPHCNRDGWDGSAYREFGQ